MADAPATEDAPLPLLLHSLVLYREVLEACLDAVAPDVLVEIGSEGGEMSRVLAGWAGAHAARLVSIEPFPSPLLRELAADPNVTVVEGYSPEALAEAPRAGFYLVDGDHNYATVRAELEHALDGAQPAATGPLVVLHDMGWPCARRDLYYDPDRLEPAAVHEHTWMEGIRPGVPDTGRGGFRGAGGFAAAKQEGGERNGVLTAVEDVLATREGFELLVVAPVFGVGFVFPREAPWAGRIRDALEPLAGSSLLRRLERNRLDLYLRVLDLQDELENRRAGFDRARAALEADLADAQAEVNRLRGRLADRPPERGGAAPRPARA